MYDPREHRLKAVFDFLHDKGSFVSAHEVAAGVGISWTTAKNDLDYLASHGLIVVKHVGKSERYRFNFE